MLILSGHSLTASRKIPVESMSLQLKERDSTATLTLGPDAPALSIGTWLQDETDPGKGIVWRVKSIRQAYGQKTTTVQLEHVVAALKDRILFGEITPEKMSGRKGAKNCTAKEAIQYALKQQSDWTLGTIAYNVSNPYKFDGNSLFDAIETVCASLQDCWWTYDFSTYPFKISFVKKSTELGTILRAGRNLTAITKTIDKTGMYTRFYPIGKDDLHVSGGGYVEKNASTYGVISKVETDQTITTQAELTRWANERLAVHATPVVSIEVEGMELSMQTGESMDGLTLGRQCWIPLQEFSTEILETISEISYQDKINQPEVFKATLANTRNDVTKIISEEIKRGGGGGRAAARQQKEDHAWFEDTEERVSMVATGLSGAVARIDVLDEKIDLKVSKGHVIAEINIEPGTVRISASKINLDGYVTADMLSAAFTSAQQINTQQLTVSQAFTCLGYNPSWKSIKVMNEDTGSATTIYYLGR